MVCRVPRCDAAARLPARQHTLEYTTALISGRNRAVVNPADKLTRIEVFRTHGILLTLLRPGFITHMPIHFASVDGRWFVHEQRTQWEGGLSLGGTEYVPGFGPLGGLVSETRTLVALFRVPIAGRYGSRCVVGSFYTGTTL